MAHRADAADARHQRWHLVERTSFTQLFEAAVLGNVKESIVDLALIVQVDRDLGMSFDAGDGIDTDCLGHDDLSSRQIPETGELQRLGGAPRHQFGEDVVDGVSVGRAARHEDIHRHNFVDRLRLGQQRRDHLIGDLLAALRIFNVGPRQHRLHAEGVAHARHIGRHCAIAQRDKDARVRSHLADLVEIVLVAHSALD